MAPARFRSCSDQPFPKIIHAKTATETRSRTHPSPFETDSAVSEIHPSELEVITAARANRANAPIHAAVRFCPRSFAGSYDLEGCSPASPKCLPVARYWIRPATMPMPEVAKASLQLMSSPIQLTSRGENAPILI